MRWGAVVAAGGEAPLGLIQETGHRNRATVPFGGQTVLHRTLCALQEAGIEQCVTVGSAELSDSVHYGRLISEGSSAIDNAWRGAQALGREMEGMLFFPADTPLVEGPMVRSFLAAIEDRLGGGIPDRWYATGICPTESFLSAFPGAPVKSLRLRGTRFVTGGLYATNLSGLRHGLDLFSEVRRRRKSIARLAWRLGPGPLMRYATGMLSLPQAERALERLLGGVALLDPTAHPATCMDFDTPEEYRALRSILGP